jgi:hypothetical protein
MRGSIPNLDPARPNAVPARAVADLAGGIPPGLMPSCIRRPAKRADSRHPRDAASRFGAWAPAKLPGASLSDSVEEEAGAVGHPYADDRWVNLPPRDDGAFPTRDFDQASAFQGGEGAMNRAGRHVVTPGYLRQGGQHIAGLNRAAGDRAA